MIQIMNQLTLNVHCTIHVSFRSYYLINAVYIKQIISYSSGFFINSVTLPMFCVLAGHINEKLILIKTAYIYTGYGQVL